MNSAISQTASNINLSVDQKLTNYSTTTQMNAAIDVKANQITSTVSQTYATKATTNTLSSRISQTAKAISLSVNNGSTSSGITITTTKEDGTTATATGTIQMNGLVTFTNLSTANQTQINGANITTGIIKSSNYVSGSAGTSINLSNGVIDSKNFKISSNGSLTATNATISGNITATSGTIGGATISNGVLTIKNANIESINGSKISDGTIGGGKISSNTITGSNIANSTITGGKIGYGTITGSNILNTTTITCGKLTATGDVTTGAIEADQIVANYNSGFPYSGFAVNGNYGVSYDVIYKQEDNPNMWRRLRFLNGLLIEVNTQW